MNVFIIEKGLVFSVNEFKQKFSNEELIKLKKYYTINTLNPINNTYVRTSMVYTFKADNENYVQLPKFSIRYQTKKKYINSVSVDLPKFKQRELSYIGRSNKNQLTTINYLFDTFFPLQNENFKGCILKATAGSGKTFLAMDIISKLKIKTMIVVPNEYMLHQWKELLEEFFPDNTIGCFYGKEKTNGDIIVSIINTASMLEEYEIKSKERINGKIVRSSKTYNFENKILKNIGLMIFDECHLYVSKQYKQIYQRLYSKYTIGLSATPERDDKLHRISELNIGPIVDANEIPGYEINKTEFNANVTLLKYRCKDQYATLKMRDDGKMIDFNHLLNQIIEDPDRNNIIVNKIINLINEHNAYIFVFSDRRNHLEILYDLLQKKIKEIQLDANIQAPELDKNIILYGGSSTSTIDTAKVLSSVIFTTYMYSSTGVSIPKMTAMILCTPRKKKSTFTQIVGRIFRLGSDLDATRHIIDIVDCKLIVKNGFRERLKVYEERNCEVFVEDYYAE